MKKKLFNLSLIVSAIASATLVAVIIFLVGEKYFFDKLIYKKSTLHGYYSPHDSSDEFFKADNPFFNDPRHKDIASLFIDNQSQALELSSGGANIDDYKIAILGDSMSYGVGVRSSQSYPVLLEKYLNDLEIENINFTVLNYSMNGDDILDHYVKYLNVEREGGVDLYVLSVITNDFDINRDDKYPGKNEIYDQLASQCEGVPVGEPFGDEEIFPGLFEQHLMVASENSVNNCFFELILNEMKGENIVAFAIEDFYFDMHTPKQVNVVYAQHLLDHGIEIWGFWASLWVNYEKLALSVLESHPNSTAHKVYSYYLAKNIINKRLGAIGVSDELRHSLSNNLNKLLTKEVAKLN